mmetsp:Transcript_25722/g.79347  ORF Transcript_25722/g.79347 Transcript_25722/m.79347 type:complete len:258 (-) Transcript_25722:748-1521(-)
MCSTSSGKPLKAACALSAGRCERMKCRHSRLVDVAIVRSAEMSPATSSVVRASVMAASSETVVRRGVVAGDFVGALPAPAAAGFGAPPARPAPLALVVEAFSRALLVVPCLRIDVLLTRALAPLTPADFSLGALLLRAEVGCCCCCCCCCSVTSAWLRLSQSKKRRCPRRHISSSLSSRYGRMRSARRRPSTDTSRWSKKYATAVPSHASTSARLSTLGTKRRFSTYSRENGSRHRVLMIVWRDTVRPLVGSTTGST